MVVIWLLSYLKSPMPKVYDGRILFLPCWPYCICTCSNKYGNSWKLVSHGRLSSIQNLLGLAKVCMCDHHILWCMEDFSPSEIIFWFVIAKDCPPCPMMVSFSNLASSYLNAIWTERVENGGKGKIFPSSLSSPNLSVLDCGLIILPSFLDL